MSFKIQGEEYNSKDYILVDYLKEKEKFRIASCDDLRIFEVSTEFLWLMHEGGVKVHGMTFYDAISYFNGWVRYIVHMDLLDEDAIERSRHVGNVIVSSIPDRRLQEFRIITREAVVMCSGRFQLTLNIWFKDIYYNIETYRTLESLFIEGNKLHLRFLRGHEMVVDEEKAVMKGNESHHEYYHEYRGSKMSQKMALSRILMD